MSLSAFSYLSYPSFPRKRRHCRRMATIGHPTEKRLIDTAQSPYYITEEEEIRSLIKPRKRFAHKGTFGHALLIAGSYGMAGASILSARACLRSGVGLLTVHVPIHNHDLLQTTVPKPLYRQTYTTIILPSPWIQTVIKP